MKIRGNHFLTNRFCLFKSFGLLSLVVLTGCHGHKEVTHEALEQTKETVIETRVEHIYIPDTVYVELPRQTAETVTRDSVSHLENDYSESWAAILPDGMLSHTLQLKDVRMPVQTFREVIYRDSIRDNAVSVAQVSDHIVTKTVKPRLYSFYRGWFWATALAIVALAWWIPTKRWLNKIRQ